MSVYVSVFKGNPGGLWTVVHDDAAGGLHSGSVQPSGVDFVSTDGALDFRGIAITCPVCGATSYQPVAGGASGRAVQEMFLRRLLRPGAACPCGSLPAGRPLLLIIAHLKGHADQMDYAGRWQITSGNFSQ